MLCESIAALLIRKGLLARADLVESIAEITELKREMAGESESVVVSMMSIGLLRAIGISMAAAEGPPTDGSS